MEVMDTVVKYTNLQNMDHVLHNVLIDVIGSEFVGKWVWFEGRASVCCHPWMCHECGHLNPLGRVRGQQPMQQIITLYIGRQNQQ
jgi:hypothetical protein